MKNGWTLRLLLAIAVIGMPGCSEDDDNLTEIEETLIGTYTLRSVAGKQLPHSRTDQTGGVETTISEKILLEGEGECEAEWVGTYTFNGQTTTSADVTDCEYEVDGTAITLDFVNDQAYVGTLSNNEIRITNDLGALVFRRD